MTSRDLLILIGQLALASVALYYGIRLLRLKNHILGYEWLVICVSASCFFIYSLGGPEVAVHITLFLDLFSRLYGVPVLVALGFMVLTHGLRFSFAQEAGLFVLGVVLSVAFRSVPALIAILPYAFLVMFALLQCYLIYVARLLFKAGAARPAWALLLLVVPSAFIALLQDFVKLPGDETAVVMNQLFLEHVVWSIGCAVTYYAYAALEKARDGLGGRAATRGSTGGIHLSDATSR